MRVARQQAPAGVPAQNSLVIAGGAERLRFLVPTHRLPEPLIRHLPRSWRAGSQPRLGAPLTDDARVVPAFVFVLQTWQNLLCATNILGECLPELIGNGQ